MSYCPVCRTYYREPEDEQGDHPCPKCGLLPPDRHFGDEEGEDEDEDE